MRRIISFVRNTTLQRFSIIFLWLVIICGVAIAIFKQSINADACYYIAVSRLLNDGLKLFVDFNPGYTPLSFYLMRIPQLLVGQDFTVLLSILFLIQFVNAYILYRICYWQTKSRNLSHWAAIFFMIFSLIWCSEYVLEPFVLLFGLLSMSLLSKMDIKHLFVSGLFCFCSFWCKQYGLGFIFLVLAYVFIKGSFCKQSIKYAVYVLTGFLFGALFFVFLLLLQGATLADLPRFAGENYERDGIQGLLGSYILLFKLIPFLLVPLIVILIKYKRAAKSPMIAVSLFGIVGFMLQCYIRFYGHYLVLAIPFCALLFVLSVRLIMEPLYVTYYKMGLLIALLIPLYFFSSGRLKMLQSHDKEQQLECARQVKNLIPEGNKNVFASQDMLFVTLLNTYDPPLLRQYGLSNGFVREPSSIMELCQNAQYCIIGADESRNTRRYTDQVNSYLKTDFVPSLLYGSDGNIVGKVLVRKN